MRPPFHPSIARLGVRPDQPGAVVGSRPRGSRRPHMDATVAAVRRLIEQTALTYGEIAMRTGVGRASICRWTRDGGWQRPLFAPRATDTVPSARASAKLKSRTLAARLAALAERAIRELEESASVDLDRLGEALELMKMAKLAARPRRRRRPATEAADDGRRPLQRPHAVLKGCAPQASPWARAGGGAGDSSQAARRHRKRRQRGRPRRATTITWLRAKPQKAVQGATLSSRRRVASWARGRDRDRWGELRGAYPHPAARHSASKMRVNALMARVHPPRFAGRDRAGSRQYS
jgi:hypothetical protein